MDNTSGRSGSGGAVCAPLSEPAAQSEAPPRATLRGLNNLGNTCFMNCVLQMLLHAPPLQAFFLGGGHEAGATPSCCSGDTCLACAMDALFTEMNDSQITPFSPANVMLSWWSLADDLAGYRQQDAHEFYLSLLSGLHDLLIEEDDKEPAAAAVGGDGPPHGPPPLAGSRCGTPEQSAIGTLPAALLPGVEPGLGPRDNSLLWTGSGGDTDATAEPANRCSSLTPPLSPQPTQDAAATAAGAPAGASNARGSGAQACATRLVDGVFGGLLHSEVTCLTCGTTSVASDPFLDISLEIVEPGSSVDGVIGSGGGGGEAPTQWQCAASSGDAATTQGKDSAAVVAAHPSHRGSSVDAKQVRECSE